MELIAESVSVPNTGVGSEPSLTRVETPTLQLLLHQQQMMLKFMEEQKGINRQLLRSFSQVGAQNVNLRESVCMPEIMKPTANSTFNQRIEELPADGTVVSPGPLPVSNESSDIWRELALNMSTRQSGHLVARRPTFDPRFDHPMLFLEKFDRYDFAKYDSTIEKPATYQNKLPVIDKLLKNSKSSRLYKFIADPPTTTMQRLKALTTGSLPTFIDAGSNFASSEISEDNIIDQIGKQLRDIVFLGDDTWESLYPNKFKRSYPYPSFNVFDLDTVDEGVIINLFPEMEKKDWDLIIAHFLGVDHCGHRYGPMHPEMSRKLSQMNEVIENVVDKLDDDTVLFVIGDHGMTGTGDHGGESNDEVNSAMFVYSKGSLNPTDETFDSDIIKQIDLVPTLAIILGIPIPHSNLGSLVVDALPTPNNIILSVENWYFDLFAVWSNVQQMTKYIKDYAITSETFSQEKLQILYEQFELLNARVHTVSNINSYKVFIKETKEYKRMLRKMCEEVWIQFDSFSMSRGLILSFMTIFLVYMIVAGIPNSQLPDIIKSSFLPCSYAALLFACGISIVCFYFSLVDTLSVTIYFGTGLVSVFMLSVLVIQNWESISIHWFDLSTKRSTIDLLLRLIFLFSWCGLLSNSYIVEEGNASMFLLFTTILLIVYDCNLQKKLTLSNFRQKLSWSKLKLLLMVIFVGILIRLSTLFFKCREEQPQCLQSLHSQIIKPGFRSEKAEYLVTLLAIAIFVTTTRNWLRSSGNLVGISPTVLLASYIPTVIVVATAGFWILHGLSQETKTKIMTGFQTDSLACLVYSCVTIGILSVIIKPLCIYIIPNSDVSTYKEDQIIPQIFHRVKGLFNQTKTECNSKVPIVCGLATVYSSAFIIFSIYLCLLLILLLGDVIAPSVVLLYFSSTIVLIISSISKFDKAITTAQLFEVPNSCILTWMLMSLYFFYGSGHQATFPNISWEAAFIGTGGNFSNNFIPGILIILNTFGVFIFMGITLPLLFIAPFTLHIMFPSLCNKKQEDSKLMKDLSRGEVLLYEKDEIMFSVVFTVSCKYILFHAVRIFISMLAATIHCRHLMVWKIFAPKLIFEAIGIIVTLVSVLFGYLLLIRINSELDRLITQLNKKYR
ncbi:hypothetical protein RN001_001740 [Aquatica leii]|uniref:GPI ethanolamine phosphate transferase 3 n=1 Tax=Aquatica leii TaxID=1421715 RepID=A0AAN7Q4I6_9COLE|nr:hypothetical protein RN001_001740 [Aquatica leii]